MILGQDCYAIHHPLEFIESDNKDAPWAVSSEAGWVLSNHLQTQQVATLARTATSVSESKLASHLSRWWHIESYASICDVTGHSKDEERAIKLLARTTRFTGET